MRRRGNGEAHRYSFCANVIVYYAGISVCINKSAVRPYVCQSGSSRMTLQFDDDETHGPSEAASYISQGDPLLTVS